MKKSKIFLITFLFVVILTIVEFQGTVNAAQTSGLTNGYIYNLINRASEKCLNVNYGTDANGTNVNQYTKDGSPEQRFKLVYNSSSDAYKLYAICSSNGSNRVIDIYKPIQSGANIDIWTPNDHEAQYFIITDRGSGYYSLHPKYNTNLALTSYGTGNGGGSGTSSTSTGNVFVSTYTGSYNQLWKFKKTSANISSWNNNSLSNNKISIIYACYGADTPTGGTSILDAVHGRGSQCSVAWHDQVYIPAAEEWNRLFWEKVCNENETVVEGYRHADYWLNDIYGTTYYINMNTNREERGNIYINL